MPQVIVLALLGACLYAGYRRIARFSKEIAAQMQRRDEEFSRRAAGRLVERDLGALEYDAESGVYRPAKRS